MNYRLKRVQNRLNKSYIAYKLGISEKDYSEVELGVKGLSSDKLEILSEMYANIEKYRLEQNQLRQNAKIWYENIDNLEEEFNKFGYNRQTMAQALNCSLTKIWDYINKHIGRISEDGKLQFYLFLHNENNRRYPRVKSYTEIQKNRKEEEKMINDPRFYYEDEISTRIDGSSIQKGDPTYTISEMEFEHKIDNLREQLETLKAEKDRIYKEMMLYKIRSEAYEKALMNMYNN